MRCWLLFVFAAGLLAGAHCSAPAAGVAVFNVKDYGATGHKPDNARPAIQRAIDACAAAGGGLVYVPPGEYTSGTLHLRSHVRFEIEAGATLFASPDPKEYDYGATPSKAALFYGERIENISLGGRGAVDGQAEHEWRDDDYESAFDHKILMQKLGKPIRRAFPKGFPERTVFPHLVWLGNTKDAHITDLNFRRSPIWTMALYACERVVCDRLDIRTSLKAGVWADGIDLDGCQDVSIANSTIATGDDCIAIFASTNWGPAVPCQNIRIHNCRLTSSSAGLKFTEGNRGGVRNVQVSDTLFDGVNRGVVFLTGMGGTVRDVVISDVMIRCVRRDWFWAGDGQPFFFRVARLSELMQQTPRPDAPSPGRVRDITIRNVTAHAQGSSRIHGHPESPIEDLRFENVKLFVATDPTAPFDTAKHALEFRHAKNLKLRGVEVFWEQPKLEQWQSALSFENVHGLFLDDFAGRAAWPKRQAPVIVLNQVTDAVLRHARARAGTGLFLQVNGPESRNIALQGNDFRAAKTPFQLGPDVPSDAVNLLKD